MKRIIRYFLQGILYLAPLAITGYIIYMLFRFTDGLLQEYLEAYLHIKVPGLGILIIVLFLVLLGWVGQSIIARPFRILINKIISRAPLVRDVYNIIRDLFSALVGKEKKFTHPVLVKVNAVSELEKLGFLTQSDLKKLGEKEKVAVYFPHSYNFSGELFIVPAVHVRPLDLPPGDVMKFIVSGGVGQLYGASRFHPRRSPWANPHIP